MINMERQSWEDYFFTHAKLAATRSTCTKRKVGAVLVRDTSILATGYNGAPSKVKHCTKDTCLRQDIPSGQRHELCRACLHGDTLIKLLNGTSVPIKDLIGKEVWGYAYDEASGSVVPAKLYNFHLSKKAPTIKTTFEDGTFIKTTDEHEILTKNESFKKICDLTTDDSLMPGRWKNSKNPWFDGYEEIYHPSIPSGSGNQKITFALEVIRKMRLDDIPLTADNYSEWRSYYNKSAPHLSSLVLTNKITDFDNLLDIEASSYGVYQLTHHMVAAHCKIWGENIHHKDFTKTNNEPSNLEGLTEKEHRKLHSPNHPLEFFRAIGKLGNLAEQEKYKKDPIYRQQKSLNGKNNMLRNWKNLHFLQKMKGISQLAARRLAAKYNQDLDVIKKRSLTKTIKGLKVLIEKNNFIPLTSSNYELLQSSTNHPRSEKYKIPKLSTLLKYFSSVEEAYEKALEFNHSPISFEPDDTLTDVYDFSCDIYHNCLVDLGNNTGIFVHNCHAEQNVLMQAARFGIATDGAEVYCTHKPCSICVKLMINAGIARVYYLKDYPDPLTDELIGGRKEFWQPNDEVELELIHWADKEIYDVSEDL